MLLAARLAGIDTVYRIGGAQAIAALAYGTATIAPVDKITGPGNAYVAAAKRRVFGRVGIDMIAGPSEVLILADAGNDPDWLALDLLAQAEHDASRPVDPRSPTTPASAAPSPPPSRRASPPSPAATSPARAGATTARSSPSRDWDEAAALADRIAPEHLQICTADAEALAAARPPRRRHLHRRAAPPRRSATTSAARTTCCPPRARRASPPASRCSTS